MSAPMSKLWIVALALVAAQAARAEQIVVSNYAVTTNGMPFAVAMDKGYFKEFGANVDGILTSDGGGTTVRNLLGGKLAYGEPAVSAIASAGQGGAPPRTANRTTPPLPQFHSTPHPTPPPQSPPA